MMPAAIRPIGTTKGNSIIIHKKWLKALRGIEGFSHVMVITWLNKAHKPQMMIHPRGNRRIKKIGYLATRTPHRFNPIGLTIVKLVKRSGTVFQVDGLDVWDGTPVMDIKPYTKKDFKLGFRMPKWVKQLDRLETNPLRKYAS